MQERRLGRKAVKTDSRTLRLTHYLTTALPPPPIAVDWSDGISSFGMMLNDSLGDCTVAGLAHGVQIWSANSAVEITIPDAAVLHAYERWCGYNPQVPSSDQGGVELDVLLSFKREGFAGHLLIAFADVFPSDTESIKQSIYLFGGLYIGLMVPNYIMEKMPPVWSVSHGKASLAGGHCVFITGYDLEHISFISWGQLYKMTWGFWREYVDECHALLSQDFIDSRGLDPNGFNIAQLTLDLQSIH
jgi:hypothetical protein